MNIPVMIIVAVILLIAVIWSVKTIKGFREKEIQVQ